MNFKKKINILNAKIDHNQQFGVSLSRVSSNYDIRLRMISLLRNLFFSCLFVSSQSLKDAPGRGIQGVLLREDVTGTVKGEHYVYFQIEHPVRVFYFIF